MSAVLLSDMRHAIPQARLPMMATEAPSSETRMDVCGHIYANSAMTSAYNAKAVFLHNREHQPHVVTNSRLITKPQ